MDNEKKERKLPDISFGSEKSPEPSDFIFGESDTDTEVFPEGENPLDKLNKLMSERGVEADSSDEDLILSTPDTANAASDDPGRLLMEEEKPMLMHEAPAAGHISAPEPAAPVSLEKGAAETSSVAEAASGDAPAETVQLHKGAVRRKEHTAPDPRRKKPARRPAAHITDETQEPEPTAAASVTDEKASAPEQAPQAPAMPIAVPKAANSKRHARRKKPAASPVHETEAPAVADVTREHTAETETVPAAERTESAPRRRHAQSTAPRSGNTGKKRKKKKEHMLNTSIITGLTITIVVISASIVLSTGAITLGMEYLGVNKSDRKVTFNIPQGADSEQIADLLIENNIINNKNLFKAALRIVDEPILYPGDITLSPKDSYPDIIHKLGKQRELYETVTLTFQEGTNLRAVAAKLEKNGVCSAQDFLWQFNKKLDLPLDAKISHSEDVYLDMEGYFFPDTYEFYKEDSPYNVSKMIRENFDSKITTEMYARMSEIGMDLNQVITLASIVQWEAGSVEDMPVVASVFLNRLADPDTFPNLQSDATKNYVTKVIDRVETSTAMLDHYKNVYDTYICFGLPAGPICNPGLDAINAVLYPADTKYYYFCNNLETGESFFAETYEQHQKNLKKAGLSE